MARIHVSVVVGLAVTLATSACAPNIPFSAAELRERATVPRCSQSRAGHVAYTGDAPALAECLESLGLSEIAELRINSRGGDAKRTLDLAQRLVGKVDLVVVDGVCGSSCANYLLAIARRVVVEPDSLVVLHGSIDVEQVAEYLDKNRDSLSKQAPGTSAADMDRALERLLAKTREDAMQQAQFESERLSCRDWLDPDLHFPPGEVPERFEFLVVTKSMAERCFKQTKVERFWEPSSKDRERLDEEGLVSANH